MDATTPSEGLIQNQPAITISEGLIQNQPVLCSTAMLQLAKNIRLAFCLFIWLAEMILKSRMTDSQEACIDCQQDSFQKSNYMTKQNFLLVVIVVFSLSSIEK